MQNPLRRSTDDKANGYTINSLALDVTQLKVGHTSLERRVAEGQASIERDMSQLRSEFSSGLRDLQSSMQILNERMVSSRQINWAPVSIGVTIIIACISVGYLFVGQQISGVGSELRASLMTAQRDITAVESRGAAVNASLNSKVDSNERQITDRVNRITEAVTNMRTKIAQLDQSTVEIETQFAALETYDNLRFVALHRWFSVVYEKVFGAKFPEVFVEPKISRSRQ